MSLGDYDTSAVIYFKFTTFRPSTGAPFTLGGTPALSVYKDNSTTQTTTGVTLTADFDSVTGLNHVAIDTSDAFYAAGSFFDVVITTGTVDSVSAVGTVVGRFTLRKNSALKPTTAGRTLDVSSGGEAGIDFANIGSPTSTVNLSGTTISTSQAVASVASVTNRVTANTDQWDGVSVTGMPLPTASYTAPLDAAGTRSAIGLASANLDTQLAALETDTQDIQSRLPAALVSGRMDASVGAMAANVLTASALATDAATEIATAVCTGQMTESYRAAGVAPTLAQVAFELIAHMGESAISGTTKTLKKLDGTTAKTFTLDSSTTPTSITEAT